MATCSSHKKDIKDMPTVTVENHRLRVTLPEEEFSRIGRYGVFHTAMRMLGNRSEMQILNCSHVKNFLEEARITLIHNYLAKHGHYRFVDTIMRMHQGRMMTPGMAEDVARARAYADGVLSPISEEALSYWYLERCRQGNEPSRRELEIEAMRAGYGIEVEAGQDLAEVAERLERERIFEIEYRQRFTNLCEGWTIEIIGEMPKKERIKGMTTSSSQKKIVEVTIRELGEDYRKWTSRHKAECDSEAIRKALDKHFGKKSSFLQDSGLKVGYYGQIFERIPYNKGGGNASLTCRIRIDLERISPNHGSK